MLVLNALQEQVKVHSTKRRLDVRYPLALNRDVLEADRARLRRDQGECLLQQRQRIPRYLGEVKLTSEFAAITPLPERLGDSKSFARFEKPHATHYQELLGLARFISIHGEHGVV